MAGVKKDFFGILLLIIFISGLLKAYILPEIAMLIGREFIWIPDWVSALPSGHFIVIFQGIIPFVGVLDFFIRGGRLEKRKPKIFHILFGILLVIGGFLAVFERIFIRKDPPIQVFSTLSDTLPSGLSFGLLIPFYKLEKERRLLLFLSSIAFFYLTVPVVATVKILNPTLKGLPTYESPFWLDAWFWSDMIVNVGVGVFVFVSLFKKRL